MHLRILLIAVGMVIWPSNALASPLSSYLYRLLVSSTGPGNSVYSMELLPRCGSDPTGATCELAPVCDTSSPLCAPPRWSDSRGGWVRVESREAAASRLLVASGALARAATYLTRCTDSWGRVLESCQPVRWPEGPRGLACALFASSVWESGYREDIMTGAPPAGRGPDGEGCVMQIMPQYARNYADWLSDEEQKELTDEQVIQQLLGANQDSLERCYQVGGRMLARFRGAARHQCKGSWVYAMYSMYGTGGRCYPGSGPAKTLQATQQAVAEGRLNPVMLQGMAKTDWALSRTKTYERCMKRWPDGPELPEWAELSAN